MFCALALTRLRNLLSYRMAALAWRQRLQMRHRDAEEHYIKLGIEAEQAQGAPDSAHKARTHSRSPHRRITQAVVSRAVPGDDPPVIGSWTVGPALQTFGDLKKTLETSIGIPADKQRLLFEVRDDQIIADSFVACQQKYGTNRVELTLWPARQMEQIRKMP